MMFPGGAYDSVWDSVMPMTGKFFFLFPVSRGRRVCWLCGFCCESVRVAMSSGGGFTPGGVYDSLWNSVKPMTGNSSSCFQFQEDVGCVGMLNYWFSSYDDICPDNYIFPSSSCRTSVAVRSGRCICAVTCSSWCTFTVQFLVSVTCPLLFDRACGLDVQILRRSPQLQFMA